MSVAASVTASVLVGMGVGVGLGPDVSLGLGMGLGPGLGLSVFRPLVGLTLTLNHYHLHTPHHLLPPHCQHSPLLSFTSIVTLNIIYPLNPPTINPLS